MMTGLGWTSIAIAVLALTDACASPPAEIMVRSASIVREPPEEGMPAEVLLRVDYVTNYNFAQHGSTMAFLVPCGESRRRTRGPRGEDYPIDYPTPYDFDVENISQQVFTARFAADSVRSFIWVEPADRDWELPLRGTVAAHGVCFFVRGEGYFPNSRNSAEVRIDELLQRSPAGDN
jgi:hypothetical protein